jgi:membrane protein implicated in regulation of membrane protease activity
MGNIISIMPWIWLGLFVVLVIIEAATQGLTTIWGAISALVMVGLSFVDGFSIGWQILTFLVLTFALLATTRPVLMKKFKIGKYATNVDFLLGQEVVVVKTVEKFQKGEAKAKNGVIWSATSEDGSRIEKDSVCVVAGVDGNTLRLRVIEK